MQLSENIFTFLKELSQNNTRNWFSEHKKEYDENRLIFENFCQSVHNQIAKSDSLSEPKVYRIYRDIQKIKHPLKNILEDISLESNQNFEEDTIFISHLMKILLEAVFLLQMQKICSVFEKK